MLLFITFFKVDAQFCGIETVGYYGDYVKPNSVEAISDRIACFYDESFDYTGTDLTEELIRERTQRLLEGQFSQFTYDPSLQPNKMTFAYSRNPLTGRYEIDIELDWISDPAFCDIYVAGYLDYEGTFRTGDEFSSPEFTYIGPENMSRRLFLVKSICGSSQTGFFIIIIDKDANLTTLFTIETATESALSTAPPMPRLTVEDLSTNLLVYPNPATEKTTQVEMEISKPQKTSLSILEGSTGKLIKTMWSERLLEKGTYREQLDLDNFAAGMYYLVLQTEEGRKIQKLIIL